MKILSKKEQMRNKVYALGNAIVYLNSRIESYSTKMNAKRIWGIFSSIVTPYSILKYRHDECVNIRKLLIEWKDDIDSELTTL